jgi:hypothetical protein
MPNHDRTEKHVISIKHLPLLEDLNLKISPLKNEKVPPLDSEDTLLHTENPKDSNVSILSLKIFHAYPEPKEISKVNPSPINVGSSVALTEADVEERCGS